MRDQWHQKIDAVTGRFTCFPFAVHPVAGALDWLILVDQRPEYADEAWIVLEHPAAVCAPGRPCPETAGVTCWWRASSPGVWGVMMWWGGPQRAGITDDHSGGIPCSVRASNSGVTATSRAVAISTMAHNDGRLASP